MYSFKQSLKAFSLAEALITLTIISLILAATLPVISKRQNTTDSMWRYIVQGKGSNSSIYYGLGKSQTAIIGDIEIPEGSNGSRLILTTPNDAGGDTINRSLINFYQKTSAGPVNIGRISFDQNRNTSIGSYSLINNTVTGIDYAGIENTAIGTYSLEANTTGYASTAIGTSSLAFNTTGNSNTSIGAYSLCNNLVGTGNVAIGRSSMESNKEGSDNVANGLLALFSNEKGNYNTASGNYALFSMIEGEYNTAAGFQALYSNQTGGRNTANGFASLYSNEIGSDNTAIGVGALSSVTGNNNTAVGSESCGNIVNGSNNVCLGAFSGPPVSSNISDKLFIDNSEGTTPLIWGDFSTNEVKINGTLTTTGVLYTPTGTVSKSDARLKNIGAENKIGLERILKLKVKNYTFKKDKEKRKRIGVIAQELRKIFPDSVIVGPEGDLYVDTSEMLFAMVNSIKQLYTKTISITNRVFILEKENKQLKKEIAQINERLKQLEVK